MFPNMLLYQGTRENINNKFRQPSGKPQKNRGHVHNQQSSPVAKFYVVLQLKQKINYQTMERGKGKK